MNKLIEEQIQDLRPFRNINDFFIRIIIAKEGILFNNEGILIIGIFDLLLNNDIL